MQTNTLSRGNRLGAAVCLLLSAVLYVALLPLMFCGWAVSQAPPQWVLPRARYVAGLLLAIAMFYGVRADAATGLATVSKVAACVGKAAGDATCAPLVYASPAPTDLVRTRSGTQSSPWDDPTFKWARFDSLPGGASYEVCTSDVPSGSPAESPASTCTAWGFATKLAPATGTGSGTAVIAWGAVTQNTDGATITGVTYTVYQGARGAPKLIAATPGNALTWAAQGLVIGEHCFHVTASAAGAESSPSNEACKTITASTPRPTVITIK